LIGEGYSRGCLKKRVQWFAGCGNRERGEGKEYNNG